MEIYARPWSFEERAGGGGRGCVCKGFSPRRAKPEGKASDAASSGG